MHAASVPCSAPMRQSARTLWLISISARDVVSVHMNAPRKRFRWNGKRNNRGCNVSISLFYQTICLPALIKSGFYNLEVGIG